MSCGKVDFESAAFASAKPHRDDESLIDVSGYDIVPGRGNLSYEAYEREQVEWLETGICPDPSVYYSTDSSWLIAERQSWADRQRGAAQPADAVHFVLDRRDDYVEILASGFHWRAWEHGSPRLSDVKGDPVMSGRWIV